MRILEVKTEHSSVIKSLIEVLKEILQETNIEFRYSNEDDVSPGDNCIRILAVDPNKTVLINCKLIADKFSTFHCKKKKMSLGINLTYLHKLIKSVDKDDNLTLYMDHDDKNNLKINLSNTETGKHTDLKLKLLDLGNINLRVPSITFQSVIVIQCAEFHKLCRDMSNIADYIEIKCLKNKIIFTAKSDYGEKSLTFDNGNKVTIQFGKDESIPPIIQGIYELKTLSLFSKCNGLCSVIEIYMKNNHPLIISYNVATLGKLLLCLTPKDPPSDDECDSDDLYSDEEDNPII